LQDKIAVGVAGAIEPELIDAEVRHSREAPTRDPAAYDLYLRAFARSNSWGRENTLGSLELTNKALERDQGYGPALVLAAFLHMMLHVNDWSQDPAMSRCAGLDFARRGLRVASDDPYVLAEAGYALAYFGEDINTSIELVDRALALNPSFARGWVISGWLRLWAGQPELALAHLETAQRLSPQARRGILLAIGMAHFFTKRFETAIATLRRALQEQPNWAPTYRFLASCYAHMGRIDDAREAVGKLRAVTSVVVPSAAHWRNTDLRDFFLAGLRLAAGEDTATSGAAR
jgi:adenylate cyclase